MQEEDTLGTVSYQQFMVKQHLVRNVDDVMSFCGTMFHPRYAIESITCHSELYVQPEAHAITLHDRMLSEKVVFFELTVETKGSITTQTMDVFPGVTSYLADTENTNRIADMVYNNRSVVPLENSEKDNTE